MEDIQVREATIDDLEQLYQFEQGVIESERPYDPTLKAGHINYYDLEAMISMPHVQLVVAVSGNTIVASGYARIEEAKEYLSHDKHAYLGFMFAHPEYRGKGINKMIIETLKAWALTKQVKELRLDVYAENASAIKAYEKVGFSKHMIEMRLGL